MTLKKYSSLYILFGYIIIFLPYSGFSQSTMDEIYSNIYTLVGTSNNHDVKNAQTDIEIARNACGILEFDRADEMIALGYRKAQESLSQYCL